MANTNVDRKRKSKTIDQYFKSDSPSKSSKHNTIDRYFKKELPPAKRVSKDGPGKENEDPEGRTVMRGLQDRSRRKFGEKLVTPLATKGGSSGKGIAITRVSQQPRKFNVLTDDQIKEGKQFASPPPEELSPTSPLLSSPSPLNSPSPFFEDDIEEPPEQKPSPPVQRKRGSSEPPLPCARGDTFDELASKKKTEKKDDEKSSSSQPIPDE